MEAAATVRSFFAPDGPLARAMGEGYELRDGQVGLALRILDVLQQGGVGLFEAGTGTGKSLAYLLPAALTAHARREPVVVSTCTLHLQEQLFTKDIPLLRRASGGALPRRPVLLRGWHNYLCLLRLSAAPLSLAATEGGELLPILEERLPEAAEGSQSEVAPDLPPSLWRSVRAEPRLCLRSRCPHYQDCYVFAARRAAQEADVIVVNHHLLLADALRRARTGPGEGGIVPEHAGVILDEAHHLEEVATRHGGRSVSAGDVAELLGALQAAPGTAGPVLARRLAARGLDGRLEGLTTRAGQAAAALEGLREALRALVRTRPDDDPRYRAGEGPSTQPLAEVLADLAEALADLAGTLADDGGETGDGELPLAAEAAALAERARELAVDLAFLGAAEEEGYVFWVETGTAGAGADGGAAGEPALVAAPVEVGPLLHTAVFEPAGAAVLTSATLAAGPDLSYVRRRLGLAREGTQEARIPSPFDHRRRVCLGLPTDLPFPDDPAFAAELAAALPDWLAAAGGGAFVLFTSHRALEEVARLAAAPLAGAGRTLLRQGDLPRGPLLERFRSTPGAVLLGTDSFWEGVDVPGEALSCVVVARLPFRVPTDPVARARYEALAAEGENPFWGHSLPEAVLRLRQGFGRLLRTATDRGVVILADRRVLARAYGRAFLTALPPCTVVRAPARQLGARLARWARAAG